MTESTNKYSNIMHYPMLNLVRLVLSIMVTWSHCYPLTKNQEPFEKYTGAISAGSIAVIGFFFISGFLVAQSYIRNPSISVFIISRVSRIWPALCASLLLSILLAWATSVAEFSTFFNASIKYFYHNIKLFEGISYNLPEAFHGAPFKSVNGSLWTLPWEARMYIGLLGIGVLGILFSRATYNLLFLVCFIFFISKTNVLHNLLTIDNKLVPTLIISFMTGVFFFLNKPQSHIRGACILILAAVFCAITQNTDLFYLFLVCGVVYLLGFIDCNHSPINKTDISYGVYIYSFPIQQYLISNFGISSPFLLFITVMPFVAILSYFSWRYIEKPCMKLKTIIPEEFCNTAFFKKINIFI
jgi:peptidoglycan/LPS O-acetylase OafA/YrhL